MYTPALILCLCVIGTVFSVSDAVEYSVNIATINTTGRTRFDSEIGLNFTLQTMASATKFIWMTFNETAPEGRKDVTTVSLFFDEMDGVAYTLREEIHVSARYIGGYRGNVTAEFAGVLYHEMTHVWQWTGNRQAPRGLIEGIADYVRLTAGYVPSHWVKAGEGDRWDHGYDVTARFLDYCEGLRDGFVAGLNMKMRESYTEDYFLDLLGKSVDELWQDYKANCTQV